MCENNLETHGLAFLIPRNSRRWTEHCVYRVKNMIHSFKNHACIVSWSLGNESGFGKAFYAMREAALAIDDTRFIHYEPDTSGKVSDVLSEMYAKLEKMPLIGEKQTHNALYRFVESFRRKNGARINISTDLHTMRILPRHGQQPGEFLAIIGICSKSMTDWRAALFGILPTKALNM